MNIHIILATTIQEQNAPNTFPYRAYKNAGDADLNKQILTAREVNSEYKTEAVTFWGEIKKEIIVVSESRGMSFFTHAAFDTIEKAKQYIREHSKETLGHLRADKLDIT